MEKYRFPSPIISLGQCRGYKCELTLWQEKTAAQGTTEIFPTGRGGSSFPGDRLSAVRKCRCSLSLSFSLSSRSLSDMNAFGDSVLPFKLYLMSAYLAELTSQDIGRDTAREQYLTRPNENQSMNPTRFLKDFIQSGGICCWLNKVYRVAIFCFCHFFFAPDISLLEVLLKCC